VGQFTVGDDTLSLTVLAQPISAWAQKTNKIYRIGWVHVASPPPPAGRLAQVGALPPLEVFRARLAERGYVEGKNVIIEERWAGGDYQRVSPLAAELARSGIDVIFTSGTKTARIVQEPVKSTPLVIYSCDPFEHVTRLARQGGNVTGVTCMTTELSPKRLELLKEAIPTASRVVFLHDPEDAPAGLRLTQEAAPRLGVRLQTVQFRDRADIPNALDAVVKERPDALYIYPDPISNSERRQIAEFALKNRLPSVHAIREYVEAGGLMSYGASTPEMFRLMANQVSQILDGARPGDVPLTQATRFELVINLKTAKALGLTIPPSLLARADQVIE
jgi:putative tryptophan/tyrosine transport system substrate-binding protein